MVFQHMIIRAQASLDIFKIETLLFLFLVFLNNIQLKARTEHATEETD